MRWMIPKNHHCKGAAPESGVDKAEVSAPSTPTGRSRSSSATGAVGDDLWISRADVGWGGQAPKGLQLWDRLGDFCCQWDVDETPTTLGFWVFLGYLYVILGQHQISIKFQNDQK